MLHASSRVCRYGNGTLCSDPNGPAGFIWLKGKDGLEDWYKRFNAGENPPLPAHTDVFMNPGHSASKGGYWMGVQFRMQGKLALVTFQKLFRCIVPVDFVLQGSAMDIEMTFLFVDQLDWSQNHDELATDALDAKKMNCSPGGRRALQHLGGTHAYVFSVWIPRPNCGGHGETNFNVAGQIFASDFDHLVLQIV